MARPPLPYTKEDDAFWEKLNEETKSLLPNLQWPTFGEDGSNSYYNALRKRVAQRFCDHGIEVENPFDREFKCETPTPKRKALSQEIEQQWQALVVLFGTPSHYPFLTRAANVLAGRKNAPEDPIVKNAGRSQIRKAIKQLCREFGFPAVANIHKRDKQRLADLVRASCNFQRCSRVNVTKIFLTMLKNKEIG